MASLLRENFDVDVEIKAGRFAEFSVVAGDKFLTRRTLSADHEILEAVKAYLNSRSEESGEPPE